MSEKYPDSKGGNIVFILLAMLAIMAILANIFISMPAKAFPSDWNSEEKTCSEAGNRPGTDKPAWCPEFRDDGRIGCVPCPKDKPAQVQPDGGRRPA
jgi:hypothetical protein